LVVDHLVDQGKKTDHNQRYQGGCHHLDEGQKIRIVIFRDVPTDGLGLPLNPPYGPLLTQQAIEDDHNKKKDQEGA
jgi:hypothetical protein